MANFLRNDLDQDGPLRYLLKDVSIQSEPSLDRCLFKEPFDGYDSICTSSLTSNHNCYSSTTTSLQALPNKPYLSLVQHVDHTNGTTGPIGGTFSVRSKYQTSRHGQASRTSSLFYPDSNYQQAQAPRELSAPTEYVDIDEQSHILPPAFDEPGRDPAQLFAPESEGNNLDLLHDLALTDDGCLLLENTELLQKDLLRIAAGCDSNVGPSLALYLSASDTFEELLETRYQASECYHSQTQYIDSWLLHMTVTSRAMSLTMGTRIFMWLLDNSESTNTIDIDCLSTLVEECWFDSVEDEFVMRWLERPEKWWQWSNDHVDSFQTTHPAAKMWYEELKMSSKSTSEAEQLYQPGCVLAALRYDQQTPVPAPASDDPGTRRGQEYRACDGDTVYARQFFYIVLRSEYGSFVAAPLEVAGPGKGAGVQHVESQRDLASATEYSDGDSRRSSRKRTPTTHIHMAAEILPQYQHVYDSRIGLTRPQTVDWKAPTAVVGKLIDIHALKTLVFWVQEGLDSGEDDRRAIVTISRPFSNGEDTPQVRPRKRPRPSNGWAD